MNWIRNRLFKRVALDIAILVLAAGLMVVPMLAEGIPTGNDLPHHYRFALEINEDLRQGSFGQTWNDSANYGFGDVGIRFYPPLSYYAMNAFHAMTGDWYFSSILTFFFWFLLSGFGVYLWSREWFDETSSLVAAVIYMALPYHANQIYNAFLYAEFAAAAIIPFCFLFATRVCRKPIADNIILLAASYALLILTHLPTALITSAGLAIYALFSLFKADWLKPSLSFATAIFFGLLGSSFYLSRVFTETIYLKHAAAEFASGDFSFSRNFLLSYFSVGSDDYVSRSLWFGDLMLALTLLASIPAAILYFRSQESVSRKNIVAVAAVFAISLFFTTPLSSFLWSHLPLLSKVQFPFRWMSLVTLTAVIFIAAGFRRISGLFKTPRRPIALAVFGGLALTIAFTAFQIIRPARLLDRQAFESTVAALNTNPSCECWWPIWANKSAFENRERIAANEREFTIDRWEKLTRTFHSSDGPAGVVRVATFYYPHWRASVNGNSVDIFSGASGTIEIPIQAGQNEISLRFEEPFPSILGRFLSTGTLLAIGFLFLWRFFRRSSRSPK